VGESENSVPNLRLTRYPISLRAGHASLGTTARYIEADAEAQRKIVGLI
jgi:hypothetical protein